jgi:hypothetical protein
VSLLLVRRWVWRCAPTIASGNLIQVAWLDPRTYDARETVLDDPDLKRVIVSVGHALIVEFHCQSGGDIDTVVEAFRPANLAEPLHRFAVAYLDAVNRRATDQRLLRRPMGFR